LAQFSVAPSLDFTLNADIQSLSSVRNPFTEERKDEVSSSNLYKTFTQKNQAHFIERSANSELKHWKDFFTPSEKSGMRNQELRIGNNEQQETRNDRKETFDYPLTTHHSLLTQLHNTYIISSTPKGFMLIHQQLAHERVLYEKYSKEAHHKQAVTQKSLFPVTLELGAADAVLLEDLLEDINALGYQIEHFGNNTFVIQGTPADVLQGNEKNSIELLLEQFKHSSSDIKFSKREKLVRCLTRQNAIKAGQVLSQKEMQTLVEDLFKCQTPNTTATGNPTFIEFKEDYLDRMFTKW
jgi:DNA mismatch repair protein MutL